ITGMRTSSRYSVIFRPGLRSPLSSLSVLRRFRTTNAPLTSALHFPQFLFQKRAQAMFREIDLRDAHAQFPGDLLYRPLLQDVAIKYLVLLRAHLLLHSRGRGLQQIGAPFFVP